MRWNRLIKIGATLYLTDTTLVGGDKLITSVEGLAGLRLSHTGAIVTAIDGTVYDFILENDGQGVPVTIVAEKMTTALINAAITLINTSKSTPGETTVIFSGGPEGTLSVQVRWGQVDKLPLEYGGTYIDTATDTRVQDVRLNMTVASIN